MTLDHVASPEEIATYTWTSFLSGSDTLCVLHVYSPEEGDSTLGFPAVVSIPELNSDVAGRFFPARENKPAFFREPVAKHSHSDGSHQNTYGITLTIEADKDADTPKITITTLTPKEAARIAEFESLAAYGATKDVETRTKAIVSLMKHAKKSEGEIIYDAWNHCGCSNVVYSTIGSPDNLRAFF